MIPNEIFNGTASESDEDEDPDDDFDFRKLLRTPFHNLDGFSLEAILTVIHKVKIQIQYITL